MAMNTSGQAPRLLQGIGKPQNKNSSSKPGNKPGLGDAAKTNDPMLTASSKSGSASGQTLKCANCGTTMKATAMQGHMASCGSCDQNASF